MAEIKTKPTDTSVHEFIGSIADEKKRQDCLMLIEMMKKVTGKEPKMWGGSIIGFGDRRHKSPNTGREVDWFQIGFSPRKANLSLYLYVSLAQKEAELKKLGKHKTGKGCIYINRLSDIDLNVLEKFMKEGAAQ